jgi:hypothetical protein
MNISLCLAVFWLLTGTVLALQPWYAPERPIPTIPRTELPLSWLAFAFAVYNVIRWRMAKKANAQRRELEEARRLLEESRRASRSRLYQEPDPNFDFTHPPPPPSG